MNTVLVVAAAVGVWYLLSCWRFPFAACPLPWCRSWATRGDGKGHYRRRKPCWLHPVGDYRRVGARLIGRGR